MKQYNLFSEDWKELEVGKETGRKYKPTVQSDTKLEVGLLCICPAFTRGSAVEAALATARLAKVP